MTDAKIVLYIYKNYTGNSKLLFLEIPHIIIKEILSIYIWNFINQLDTAVYFMSNLLNNSKKFISNKFYQYNLHR